MGCGAPRLAVLHFFSMLAECGFGGDVANQYHDFDDFF